MNAKNLEYLLFNKMRTVLQIKATTFYLKEIKLVVKIQKKIYHKK